VDKEGNYVDSWIQFTGAMTESDEHQVAGASLVGVLALSMMNCKNIVTRTNHPSPKLNKARKKRGRKPLVEFKTIHVDPNTKTVKSSAAKDSGDSPRKHVAKGHLKDYRNGKGLFGKYKGIWYWGPQLRGEVMNGICLPNYTIDKKET